MVLAGLETPLDGQGSRLNANSPSPLDSSRVGDQAKKEYTTKGNKQRGGFTSFHILLDIGLSEGNISLVLLLSFSFGWSAWTEVFFHLLTGPRNLYPFIVMQLLLEQNGLNLWCPRKVITCIAFLSTVVLCWKDVKNINHVSFLFYSPQRYPSSPTPKYVFFFLV